MIELSTAFFWGLGVSWGAAIGGIAFLAMKGVFDWGTGRADKFAKHLAYDRKVLVKLTERNELTKETNDYLDRIAGATEDYAMRACRGTEVMPRDWNNRGDAESKDGGE